MYAALVTSMCGLARTRVSVLPYWRATARNTVDSIFVPVLPSSRARRVAGGPPVRWFIILIRAKYGIEISIGLRITPSYKRRAISVHSTCRHLKELYSFDRVFRQRQRNSI